MNNHDDLHRMTKYYFATYSSIYYNDLYTDIYYIWERWNTYREVQTVIIETLMQLLYLLSNFLAFCDQKT